MTSSPTSVSISNPSDVTHEPLVTLITQQTAPLLVKDMFANGDPGDIAAAYSQVPEVAVAAMPFLGASLHPGALGLRRTEFAILYTAALLECSFCTTSHSAVALDADLSVEEVRALRCETDIDGAFDDESDRIILTFIREVASGRGKPSAETLNAIKTVLPDHLIVEVVNKVGVTMLLSRFCTTLSIPSPPGAVTRCQQAGLDAA